MGIPGVRVGVGALLPRLERASLPPPRRDLVRRDADHTEPDHHEREDGQDGDPEE